MSFEKQSNDEPSLKGRLAAATSLTPEARRLAYAAFMLVGTGTVMVFSTSIIPGTDKGLERGLYLDTFFKQLIWVGIGLAGFYSALKMRIETLHRYSLVILLAILVMLVLVLVPGISPRINGAKRWFRLFGQSFQPSEFAKLSLLIFISAFMADRWKRLSEPSVLYIPIAAIGLTCGLILVEPDFGTALFLSFISGLVFLLAGVRLRSFMPIIALVMLIIVSVGVFRFDHVKSRLNTFMNPESDIRGKGHQTYQARIALGSGGLTGEGPGAGKQKYSYLPEDATDFILAILGEEYGLLGTLFVILLYLCIVYNGMKICIRSENRFCFLLSFGIVMLIGLQAAANIAVVTGAAPNKGISLPFMSFGGTSLLLNMALIGFLCAISSQPHCRTGEMLGASWLEAGDWREKLFGGSAGAEATAARQ